MGGRNPKEGVVEVCVLGHWAKTCNDKWTNREAEVVCRQLNYLSPDSGTCVTVSFRVHLFHNLASSFMSELSLLH